jgi:hypothetical protein
MDKNKKKKALKDIRTVLVWSTIFLYVVVAAKVMIQAN